MGFYQNDVVEVHPHLSRCRKCFILAAAIICNSLVEGMCQSFPEIYPIFLEEFKNSGSFQIVLIGSLLPGIYLVTSPFYCFLLGRFDFLVVMTTGSIISSAGFIGSSFASHGNHLILCYTLLAGVGFGAIHLACIVVISRTFNSYRGTAVAVVLSVSGFSGFFISPCTQSLVTWYGWRGANQICGALLLNGIACGMIFNGHQRSFMMLLKSKFQRFYRRITSKDTVHPSYIMRQMTRERERIRDNSNGSLDGFVITNNNSLVSGSQAICAQQYFMEVFPWSADTDDVFRECGVESAIIDREMCIKINYKVISGDHVIPLHLNEKINLELREFLAVLQETSFIIYSVSFIIPFIASFLVVMNLPVHAFVTGLKPGQTRVLLNVLWIISSGLRIPVGCLCDHWKVFKFVLHPLSLLTCGVLILALPWISAYEHQLIVAVFLGIFMACLVILNPIFLFDMLGVKLFAQSYSISSFFQGLSTMVAPLVSRWVQMSHSTSFIVAGIMIAVSGIVSVPLKWLMFSESRDEHLFKRDSKIVLKNSNWI